MAQQENWYAIIEEPIREIVRLLRNNGFNTFNSCGHSMTVDIEGVHNEDIPRLANLLVENGYETFCIRFYLETQKGCYWRREMSVRIGSSERWE